MHMHVNKIYMLQMLIYLNNNFFILVNQIIPKKLIKINLIKNTLLKSLKFKSIIFNKIILKFI